MSPLRPPLYAICAFAVVSLAFCAPILPELANWGILDWDQHLFHHGVPRISILEYHQIPLWNPYNFSGVPLLASPESRVLAPTFLLTLLFGEVVALKLEIVLHLWIGMLGAHQLARYQGCGPAAALATGFVFMLGSWYAIHLAVGHTWALNVAWLPWAFLFYQLGLRQRRYTTAAAIALVLAIFGGGVYPAIMTAMLLVAFALASSTSLAAAGRHAKALLLVGAQTALLGAVKLLPAAELMQAHPRDTAVAGGFTPAALWNALFDRTQTLSGALAERPQELVGWSHEGMYVGLLALLPFAVGVADRGRRGIPLLVVLLVFLWISLGDQVALGPWPLLHRLPVFDNLRMVQRFGIVAVLMAALFVGFGVEACERRARGWLLPARARALALALAALLLADLFLVNAPILREAFPIPPMQVEHHPRFRQLLTAPAYDAFGRRAPGSNPQQTTLSGLYPSLLSNRGLVLGYEVVPVPSRAIPVGHPRYRGEVELVGTRGRVEMAHWSPNRLEIHVVARGAGTVVVNQNHAPGWGVRREGAASPDVSVGEREGRLAVPVHGGEETLVLTYLPTSFVVGALVSASTLAALAALAWRQRARSSA